MSVDVLFWCAAVAVALAGAAVTIWALFADRARGRRRCPRCWYDMSATDGRRCPECGRETKSERYLLKTRRRWGWAAVAMLVLVGAAFLAVQVQRGRWMAIAPTTLLILNVRAADDPTATLRELQDRVDAATARASVRAQRRDAVDEEPLSAWQWRLLGHSTLDRLEEGETLSADDRAELIAWAVTASLRQTDPHLQQRLRTALVQLLDDPAPEVRLLSAASIARSQPPPEAVELISPLLEDWDPFVARGALEIFTSFVESDISSKRELEDCLDALYGDLPLRSSALYTLKAWIASDPGHEAGPRVLEEMSIAFGGDSSEIRQFVKHGIEQTAASATVTPLLQAALKHPDEQIRLLVLDEVRFMDTHPPCVVNAVMRGLTEEASSEMQHRAAEILERIDAEALHDHIEHLQSLTQSRNPDLKWAAQAALERLRHQ